MVTAAHTRRRPCHCRQQLGWRDARINHNTTNNTNSDGVVPPQVGPPSCLARVVLACRRALLMPPEASPALHLIPLPPPRSPLQRRTTTVVEAAMVVAMAMVAVMHLPPRVFDLKARSCTGGGGASLGSGSTWAARNAY